jgi:hypothetical protein
MRTVALGLLLCGVVGVASAQTTEQCQSLKRAGDLIACYDRTAPPITSGTTIKRFNPAKAVKPQVSPAARDITATTNAPAGQSGPRVDMLAAENAKLVAKMKTICRGC